MEVYDRQSDSYVTEKELGDKQLEFLYNTVAGRILLKLFISRPIFSKIRARYYKSKSSKKKIKQFIKEYKINMMDFKDIEFNSFNEFFIRKKKYITKTSNNELMSIADAKVSVYKIDDNLKLKLKNTVYKLSELVDNKVDTTEFKDGHVIIFRLGVEDYHRFVYIDNCEISKYYKIKGLLHTIRPISSEYKSFSSNCRDVTVLSTQNFGRIVEIDIGALLVGCINQHHSVGNATKLEEKGYFEYGGSTIVLLVNNTIKIDDDIMKQSEKGYETKVHIGEKIGCLKE